jgi:hypothetical protein
MKIVLQHLIGKVTITTPNDDPDEPHTPTIESDSEVAELLTEIFESALEESAGHYGNVIDPLNVTNLDLQAACYKLEEFEVLEIEPKILPSPLPDGAIP